MTDEQVLPLFPLKGILLPGGVLSLRIFEPRYCDLVADSLRNDTRFGVVLIQAGNEVGQTPKTYQTGTSVRIQDWRQGSDGLLNIDVLGEQRFCVKDAWVQDNGLMVGHVTMLPSESPQPLPDEYQRLVTLLKAMQEHMQPSLSFDGEPRYEDAVWVGYRLLEHVPMPSDTRQTLCETSGVMARLSALSRLLDQMIERAAD